MNTMERTPYEAVMGFDPLWNVYENVGYPFVKDWPRMEDTYVEDEPGVLVRVRRVTRLPYTVSLVHIV